MGEITDAQKQALAAAGPPLSGVGAPGSTPIALGQSYTNLSNGDFYTAVGTSSSADWHLVSGGVGGVSDGDKGDITVSGSGTAWAVDNDAITFAKMQNASAASRLVGRGSASGSGDFEEITLGTNLSMSGTTLNTAAAVVTGSAPADVTKAAAAVGVATAAARADHKHDVTTAAPAATGVGTSSGEGTATTLARSDHSHQSNTAPSDITKAAAAIGTSGQPARADHKHDISTAAAADIAAANAEGSATSLARSDHTHKVPADYITFAMMVNASAASKLLGRGSASGAGDFEEITLGTNLSMSGTTLNASGGGGTNTSKRAKYEERVSTLNSGAVWMVELEDFFRAFAWANTSNANGGVVNVDKPSKLSAVTTTDAASVADAQLYMQSNGNQMAIPSGGADFYFATLMIPDFSTIGATGVAGWAGYNGTGTFRLGLLAAIDGAAWTVEGNGASISGGTIAANTPARLEVLRLGGTTTFYVNGTSVGTSANVYPASGGFDDFIPHFVLDNGGSGVARRLDCDEYVVGIPCDRTAFP